MKSGIYAIVAPSGNAYVGSSRNLLRRKIRHFHDLKYQRHHCSGLQNAWNKYKEQLYFIVLEHCEIEQLVEREQFWLDHRLFRLLYNSNLIAGNPLTLSDETKMKISIAKKGKLKSELTKSRMRKPKSASHAAAISAGKRGKSPVISDAEREARRQRIKIAQESLRIKRKIGYSDDD